jgi:hypothetical protein
MSSSNNKSANKGMSPQQGFHPADGSSERRLMQAHLASRYPGDRMEMDVIYENRRVVTGTGVRTQQMDTLLMEACGLVSCNQL